MTTIEVPASVMAQTVLVVDDDYALSSALADALVRPGRDVIVCRDVESARMVLDHRLVTHIVTDLRFASGFGYEGFQILERVRRTLSMIPVVVISGYVTNDIRREAVRPDPRHGDAAHAPSQAGGRHHPRSGRLPEDGADRDCGRHGAADVPHL